VSSAILTPGSKATVIHDGHIRVGGWAYSGGGRHPVRVDGITLSILVIRTAPNAVQCPVTAAAPGTRYRSRT
jgi:hypothetical protein